MLAASYWSLLEPALEMAAGMETYGSEGQWAFLPVSLGFLLGAAFVYGADLVLSRMGISSPTNLITHDKKWEGDSESPGAGPEPGVAGEIRWRGGGAGAARQSFGVLCCQTAFMVLIFRCASISRSGSVTHSLTVSLYEIRQSNISLSLAVDSSQKIVYKKPTAGSRQ